MILLGSAAKFFKNIIKTFDWNSTQKSSWLCLNPLYLTFQVRVHWLLDLMEGPFKIGSRLDSFVHLLWSNNLRPGFEIMGNPGQFFQSNFTGTLLSETLAETIG